MTRRSILAALAPLLVWVTTAAGQQQSPQLVDRIVALVDEEAILLSDLEREVESYRLEAEATGTPVTQSEGELREEMLNRLIEVKLLVAHAKVEGIDISDEELDRSVARVMEDMIDRVGTRRELDRELARNGMSYADLEARQRELVRSRMYTARLVNTFVRPKVQVTEEDVRAFYDENRERVPSKPPTVTLANIVVVPQPDPQTRDRIEAKLQAIQKELDAGSEFADVVRAHSEGPNADSGGKMGPFSRGDLFSPILEEAAWNLDIGEVSGPLRTEIGVFVIQVEERTDTEVTLRQVFLRMEIQAEQREAAAERARDVARQAREGQDFAELARKYSDDPTSRERGGELGTFPVNQLREGFQEALQGLEPGQVAEPIEGKAGWFVLKLIDRQEGEAPDYDEIRDQLRNLAEEQKIQDELNRLLVELRQSLYVDIKG